jgi:molybdopterin-binding protein
MEVRAEGLGRRAGRRPILAGIDLALAPGAVNVVLGPNGAGKTTLLRLLGLLDRADEGDILYDGLRLGALDRRGRTRLRRRCGFVFQAPLLLAGSVEDNLRFAVRLRGLRPDDAALDRVLERTGLAGRRRQDARLLSGGEKQRLQLARILLLDPELCLLDEPTANLDPLSVKSIEAAIAGLARAGRTVVLATHNLTQARLLSGRIAFLKAGRLVQSGPTAEVLGRPLSLDIAEFSAAENILHGRLVRRAGTTFLDCGPLTPPGGSQPGGLLSIEVVSERSAGRAAAVIRPEDILLSAGPLSSSARNSFRGTVAAIADLGALMAVTIACSGVLLTAFITPASCAQMGLRPGGGTTVTFKATSVHLLPLD